MRKTPLPYIGSEGKRLEFEAVATGFRKNSFKKKEIRRNWIESTQNFKSLKHVASVESGLERLKPKNLKSRKVGKGSSRRTTFCEVPKSAFK